MTGASASNRRRERAGNSELTTDAKQTQPRIAATKVAAKNNRSDASTAAENINRRVGWRLSNTRMDVDLTPNNGETDINSPLDDEGLLQIEEIDGTLVVSGDLDLHQTPEFRERAEAYIKTTERPRLDLSHVPFLDSAGLAALLALSRIAKAQNKSIRMIAVGSPHRVLRITGIDRVLVLED